MGLLGRECNTILPTTSPQNDPDPVPAPAPAPATPPSSTAGSESANSQSSLPTNEPTPPLEMSQTLRSDLPSIPKVDVAHRSTDQPLVAYSTNVLGVNNTYGTMSTVSDPDARPLQATTEGWKIIGVAWYWWVATIGGIVGLYYLIKFLINKSLLGVAKTP